MRIPRYTSQTTGITRATPGSPMRARMNAEPYVQEALAKGRLVGEAARQVGEFAQMRYKMEREAALDNALIGAEEQMREEYYRLSKLKTPHDVFGEKKLWESTTNSIIDKNRDLVGNDRSAVQAYDEAVRRSELSLRFSLRSKIDTNIEANNQAARKQRLVNAQRDGIAATDIKELQLIFKNIGIDSDRRAELDLGNPVLLKEQERSLIKNIAATRLQRLVDSSDIPSTFMEALRRTVLNGEQGALVNPAFKGEGLIEARLLEALPLDDRVSLLRGGEALAKYIDAPTLEQEAVIARAQAQVGLVEDEISVKLDLLKNGTSIPGDEIVDLANRVGALSGVLDADEQQKLLNSMNTLSKFSEFQIGLSKFATPDNIEQIDIVKQARAGDITGKKGALDADDKLFLDYIDTFKESMIKGLESDPVQYISDSNAADINPLNITLEAARDQNVGLRDRIITGTEAQGRFGAFYMPEIKLLTNEEAAKIVGTIRNAPDAGFVLLQDMQKEAGKHSQNLMNQLEDAGLTPELLATGYVKDGSIRAALGEASKITDTRASEIVNSVTEGKTSFDDIGASIESTPGFKDLRLAYSFGRGVGAFNSFMDQKKAAQKAVAVLMSQNMEKDQAIKKVVSEMFSEKDSVINNNDAILYLTQQFAPQANQIESNLSYLKRNSKELFTLKPLSPIQKPRAPEATMILSQDALRSSGKWLLNNTEDGAIFHYTLDDGTPIMALDAFQRPYEIKFSKLSVVKNKVQGLVTKEAEEAQDPTLGYYREGQKLRTDE
jgi:hypothetical protein